MHSRSTDGARLAPRGHSQSRRRRLPRWLNGFALSTLAIGPASLAHPCSPPVFPQTERAGADLPTRIHAILSAGDPIDQAAQLAVLGPEAVQPLLDALVALPAVESPNGTKDPRRQPLFDALGRFEPSVLRGELERRAAGSPGYLERTVLVQLLRRVARAQDTELILQLADPEGLAPLHAFFVAEEARQSLAALFRRDPPSAVRVSWLACEVHPSLVLPILEATAALKPLARISVLVDVLRARPAFAPQLLGWLSVVHGDSWDLPEASSAGVVRPYLEQQDPDIAAAAARALGVLEDHDALGPLIACLAHEQAAVREAAHDALRALTGLSLPLDAARWRRWHDAESTWRERRAPAAIAKLNSPDRAERAAALQEIGRRRIDRHALAHDVAALLDSADDNTVELACVTLRELGSPVPIGGLIVLLETAGETRTGLAAHACLQSLTGLSLPPDPKLWSAAYELRRLQ
jgi:hypothetical protein